LLKVTDIALTYHNDTERLRGVV